MAKIGFTDAHATNENASSPSFVGACCAFLLTVWLFHRLETFKGTDPYRSSASPSLNG